MRIISIVTVIFFVLSCSSLQDADTMKAELRQSLDSIKESAQVLTSEKWKIKEDSIFKRHADTTEYWGRTLINDLNKVDNILRQIVRNEIDTEETLRSSMDRALEGFLQSKVTYKKAQASYQEYLDEVDKGKVDINLADEQELLLKKCKVSLGIAFEVVDYLLESYPYLISDKNVTKINRPKSFSG